MAKNLLIRELTDEANAALEWYKSRHGISFNTEAATQMLEQYMALQADLVRQREEISRLSQVVNQYRQAWKQYRDAATFLDILDEHHKSIQKKP